MQLLWADAQSHLTFHRKSSLCLWHTTVVNAFHYLVIRMFCRQTICVVESHTVMLLSHGHNCNRIDSTYDQIICLLLPDTSCE